jgi:hypothetical protein
VKDGIIEQTNRKMPLRRITWRVVLLLGAVGWMPGPAYGFSAAANEPEAGAPAPHKFHVTYGRMAVEDNIAILQIRLFKDDLELTLRQKYADPAFALAADPYSDSLFTQYFNEVFVLKQGAVAVPGRIVSSGEEEMAGEPMWWYMVRFEAPADLRAFTVRDVVLFDQFEDQKNIFKVQHFPSEKALSYYFTEGAEEYHVAF